MAYDSFDAIRDSVNTAANIATARNTAVLIDLMNQNNQMASQMMQNIAGLIERQEYKQDLEEKSLLGLRKLDVEWNSTHLELNLFHGFNIVSKVELGVLPEQWFAKDGETYACYRRVRERVTEADKQFTAKHGGYVRNALFMMSIINASGYTGICSQYSYLAWKDKLNNIKTRTDSLKLLSTSSKIPRKMLPKRNTFGEAILGLILNCSYEKKCEQIKLAYKQNIENERNKFPDEFINKVDSFTKSSEDLYNNLSYAFNSLYHYRPPCESKWVEACQKLKHMAGTDTQLETAKDVALFIDRAFAKIGLVITDFKFPVDSSIVEQVDELDRLSKEINTEYETLKAQTT